MLGRTSLAMVAFLVSSASALGCVLSPNAPAPICQRFWEEEAVALVNVHKIEKRGHDRFVSLIIVEIYRGHPPNELTVRDPITDCGVNFGRTGPYLAWFSQLKNGKWHAYGERVENAADDLQYAQSMRNPPSTGRIYGTLDKPRRSPLAPVLKQAETLPDRRGVSVVAGNSSRRFVATVGTDLSFDLPALPPGKYATSVEGLPPDLAVDTQEIEVHGGSCNELALFSASSARITGLLVTNGQAPRFAQVFLIPAAAVNAAKSFNSHWVMTHHDSTAFAFEHVTPGKYVLAFELGHSPTLDVPYASRFFPEGVDPQKARVIEVHPAERIEGLRFDIGNEVARRRVHVRVAWSDGSPAEKATAFLRDAHNPYSSVAEKQTPTNAKGEALLEGFVDTDYDVDANAVCKGRSVSNKIEKKIISASEADAFVALTVKGRKCELVNWQLSNDDE